MSVENPENQGAQENEHQKLVNGEQPQQVNGFSNGHSNDRDIFLKPKDKTSSSSHKSSSKDKHRDKDRDKDRSKDRHSSSSSGHRDKEKSSSHKSDKHDKDRSKSSSSSSKDKERSSSSSHKSSSKDKHRDKERKEGESKDKSSSGSSSKTDKERSEHKSSSSSSGHKSSSKDKHRDKERSDKKDKERSDKGEKQSSSSSSKDKDRKEHKSSSSSSKDKHRSDKDKHSSSSSHKSKDKDRSSTSHKSSSKDKHRSDEKREKHRHPPMDNGHAVKQEITSPSKKQYEIQMEAMQKACHVQLERVSFDELHGNNPVVDSMDVQNASQASSCDYNFSQFRTDEENFVVKEEASESESEGKPPFARGKAAVKQYEEFEEVLPLAKRKKAIESDSEEEKPLSVRKKVKAEIESDEEELPLAARKKSKTEKKAKKKKPIESEDDEDSFEEKPKKKKVKKEKHREVTKVKSQPITPQKGARKKKDDEPEDVWKWWEEEKRDDGAKWHFLEHKGPLFAPEYEPLPKHVKFEYDGKVVKLSQDAEEIAGFYGKMLESDYCEKKVFNDNFFADWRKAMTRQEREIIKDFKKCNFRHMLAFFKEQSEKNKQRSKEEKLALKKKNEEIMKEYGVCIIDNHKEKIGNFRIEPPGLFRGRGEHPKMGMLKKRVMPNDVIINCSKDSKYPEPPKGHRWREVRHDNSVTWLASWIENVQGQGKYVMLNPSSKLKGEKDWQKYETARRLLKHIDKIRATYRDEWKSKEMRIRQRAVALYFIDKLALRAGNEKDADAEADTVGCCSLRVEHVDLFREKDGKDNVVVFDFLGKDSIRYYNEVEVEKRVFKNLELFKENKKDGDDLFDRLNTSVLNEHLRDLMEGLTAKVFRTFNASYTLQKQLQELTDPDASIPEKLLAYNRANRAVAILCNHQRSVPKTHQKSMETLKEKIRLKREAVEECEQEYRDLKRGNPILREKKKKQVERLREQLQKLELQETDRDENKTIALGTSKLNYLDPRISVAWCKKHGVPLEKIFNKTQRDKFRWAIDMADENYVF